MKIQRKSVLLKIMQVDLVDFQPTTEVDIDTRYIKDIKDNGRFTIILTAGGNFFTRTGVCDLGTEVIRQSDVYPIK